MLDELIESGQEEVQVIVLRLGNEEYAVPITNVQEIITTQEITRIPKSPSFIEGVINLRGRIIPVIDGKKKCFIEKTASNVSIDEQRIMILELEEEEVGLIVDSVSEVVHLQVSEIEPPPIETGSDNNFIWGVGKFEGRLLILLNLTALISFEENSAIDDFVKIKDAIVQVSQ